MMKTTEAIFNTKQTGSAHIDVPLARNPTLHPEHKTEQPSNKGEDRCIIKTPNGKRNNLRLRPAFSTSTTQPSSSTYLPRLRNALNQDLSNGKRNILCVPELMARHRIHRIKIHNGPNTHRQSLVATIRDNKGRLLLGFTGRIQANSSLISEAMAIRQALIIVNNLDMGKL
ncbi:hypothetical protein PIB30_052646 [Stylosanthes scabra]|uniref:Ribosomal protein S5 n=1 Tax=Stylosanthes scabra TaxID=79078 RepID=A0ABU6XG18_9FABA|nr:hypothetical protein [Stylosanthes scabra]